MRHISTHPHGHAHRGADVARVGVRPGAMGNNDRCAFSACLHLPRSGRIGEKYCGLRFQESRCGMVRGRVAHRRYESDGSLWKSVSRASGDVVCRTAQGSVCGRGSAVHAEDPEDPRSCLYSQKLTSVSGIPAKRQNKAKGKVVCDGGLQVSIKVAALPSLARRRSEL